MSALSQSNRLPIIGEEVRKALADFNLATTKAAENALAAGALLNEAKSICGRGKWLPWLAQIGIAERTAQRHMKLFRAGLESAIVADLGFAAAERYASLGLDLLPKPGMAACATAVDVGEPLSAALGYWWGTGDRRVTYWHCTISHDQNWFHAPGPIPIWLLGMLEGDRASQYERSVVETISIDEAREFVSTFTEAGR